MWQALRLSCRSLSKRPAFLVSSVLTLGLCIGANSAVFSLIDAVLLRSLPYADASNLVTIYETKPSAKVDVSGVAPVQVEEWDRMTQSFSGVAGVETENSTDTSGNSPEKLFCGAVSPRFFSVLGVPPLLGRPLKPEEERFGGPPAALISEKLWRSRFAGDESVLNKSLRLDGSLYSIVGVMPASFRLPVTNDEVDVWIADALPNSVIRDREARFYITVARLKPGVTAGSAQAELNGIQSRLAIEYPATDRGWNAVLKPLKEATVGNSRSGLLILFGAVALLLLIGCANVACLLLGQAHRRAREIAVRFALGASRGQVVRQLLLESFVTAAAGAALGLLLGGWLIGALSPIAAHELRRTGEIQMNWHVVWFAVALSVLTTFIFGLIPAILATRAGIATALAHGSRTQAGGRRRPVLHVLVFAQVGLAVVLLVGAGLLIRTMASLMTVPLGFETRNILTLHISASWAETKDNQGVQHRMKRTLEVLDNTPGVKSAAIALNMPGTLGSAYNIELHIAGRDNSTPGTRVIANAPAVSDSYFRTLGIPLVAGEMCRDSIDSSRGEQAMVNQAFANQFFRGENPVGHMLLAGERAKTTQTTITGVVGDVRDTSRSQAPVPTVYWCTLPGFFPDPIYLVRTQGAPMRMANALRKRIAALEPSRAMYAVAPLDQLVSRSMGERRLQTILLSLFGLSALALASIGLYGVLSFHVSRRTREIGLRMAVGASPNQVFRQIFGQGAAITLAGVAAGIAGSVALARLMASLLFGIGQWDLTTFVTAPLLLVGVAALAMFFPARRATRVDPIVALRDE
jgi:putative ABC transport system permease protein